MKYTVRRLFLASGFNLLICHIDMNMPSRRQCDSSGADLGIWLELAYDLHLGRIA